MRWLKFYVIYHITLSFMGIKEIVRSVTILGLKRLIQGHIVEKMHEYTRCFVWIFTNLQSEVRSHAGVIHTAALPCEIQCMQTNPEDAFVSSDTIHVEWRREEHYNMTLTSCPLFTCYLSYFEFPSHEFPHRNMCRLSTRLQAAWWVTRLFQFDSPLISWMQQIWLEHMCHRPAHTVMV